MGERYTKIHSALKYAKKIEGVDKKLSSSFRWQLLRVTFIYSRVQIFGREGADKWRIITEWDILKKSYHY